MGPPADVGALTGEVKDDVQGWFMALVSRQWTQPAETLAHEELEAVKGIAATLESELSSPEVQRRIAAANQPGVSSARVQNAILESVSKLGFASERSGLFKGYRTPGLRPDYYCHLPKYDSGILLEVERGKTTINNMDLLDFWKCHIAEEAHHLFLLVPRVLQQNSKSPRVTRPFDYVEKRLASFFVPGNLTNVRSCWLFGY